MLKQRTYRIPDEEYALAVKKTQKEGRVISHIIRKALNAYSKSKTNSFKVEL